MASRRKGRILAFQALYSWDAHYSQTKDVSMPEGLLEFSWAAGDTPLNEEMIAFSRLLVSGAIENIISIDDMIRKHLQNWELKRLNRVDLAILRMSVYTLMYQPDMPPTVVIDEAVDISKEFGTDDSYRFINGILDGIRKTLARAIEKPKTPEQKSGTGL